jgi:hypothetical protein
MLFIGVFTWGPRTSLAFSLQDSAILVCNPAFSLVPTSRLPYFTRVNT